MKLGFINRLLSYHYCLYHLHLIKLWTIYHSYTYLKSMTVSLFFFWDCILESILHMYIILSHLYFVFPIYFHTFQYVLYHIIYSYQHVHNYYISLCLICLFDYQKFAIQILCNLVAKHLLL